MISVEEEEESTKRNLFKRIEEANNAKNATNITVKSVPKSYLLETLENIYEKNTQGSKIKPWKLACPQLKVIQENFMKPSPDKLIHISRND